MGKLTIVGFFSKKNVFFVNRLMYKMMNGGNLVISNRFIKLSLYVLYSFSEIPLNLASSWYKLTYLLFGEQKIHQISSEQSGIMNE